MIEWNEISLNGTVMISQLTIVQLKKKLYLRYTPCITGIDEQTALIKHIHVVLEVNL